MQRLAEICSRCLPPPRASRRWRADKRHQIEAKITAWHEVVSCTWCEKEKEGVTVDFNDGFIQEAPLCWSCLERAVKVRARKDAKPASKTAKGE